MRPRLSGLGIEYLILQIYSRDAGQRSAVLAFNVGQGTQDIGFRNDIDVLFTAAPAHSVRLRVLDERGEPATAAFMVQRRRGADLPDSVEAPRAGLFFPAAGLSCRRRDDQSAVRGVHADGLARSRVCSTETRRARRSRVPTSGSSASRAGSIRERMAGIPAITTSIPPAARTIKTRPRGCCRRTCGPRSPAKR